MTTRIEPIGNDRSNRDGTSVEAWEIEEAAAADMALAGLTAHVEHDGDAQGSPPDGKTGGAPAKRPDVPTLISRNRPLLMLGAMAGMLLQTLDTTIANVALPYMQSSLSATRDTISWVLTSYVMASAIAMPLAGWLVTRFGLRRIFVTSAVLFTVASCFCGLAQNLPQMVMCRIAQGLAGAFLAPLAQTVIVDSSTEAERPKVMALFTLGVIIGPLTGPVIGGWLTENYNWRWVFYVNVPIGFASAALLARYLPHTPTGPRRIDLWGWLLVALAVSGTQLALDRGELKDWFSSGEIVLYALTGAAAAVMAVIHLRYTRDPLFPAALFSDRNFVIGTILTCLVITLMMANMALLPSLLQSIYGYPALRAGALLASRGGGFFVTTMVMSRHMARFDPRLLTTTGMILLVVSLHMMTGWTDTTPQARIIAAGLVQGLALGVSLIPLNIISFATLPSHLRTDGASLINQGRNTCASIGISIVTVMLSHGIQTNHAELGARLTPITLPDAVTRMVPGVDPANPVSAQSLAIMDAMINRQAAMIGYIDVFHAMMIACIVATPTLLLLRVQRK